MRVAAVLSSGAVLMAVAFAAAPAQAVSITSTFDTDAEGWQVGDNNSTTTPGVGGFSAPTYQSTGGASGGFIETSDIYSSNAFYAPSAYLGDLSSFYGGTFNFSLQELVLADINPGAAVILYGAGTSIAFAAPAPGSTWTDFSVNMTETGWINYQGNQSVIGSAVSLATFQAVLGSVTGATILADWHNGADQVGLDSVSLVSGVSTVPIPAALPLLASALGGLGFVGWRRKKLDAA